MAQNSTGGSDDRDDSIRGEALQRLIDASCEHVRKLVCRVLDRSRDLR